MSVDATTDTAVPEREAAQEIDETLRGMMDAGVFLGRHKSKTHPRMKPYIYTSRNEIEIINIKSTQELLAKALGFLKEKMKGNPLILCVATQPAAERVKEFASKFKFPFVNRRWLGGTLTNFKIISKRIEHYKKLKEDVASGALSRYTKKEQLQFEKQLQKLSTVMGGLAQLTRLPDVLFVIDPQMHMTAVREARKRHIPVVALADTNADPNDVDYPVIANAKGRNSINWFLANVESALEEGRREIAVAPSPPTKLSAELPAGEGEATAPVTTPIPLKGNE